MIRRSQHWTDVPLVGHKRRRTISNWMNFRTPHHGFILAAPLIAEATRKPDDWDGNFDFQRTSQAGALQTFFGDTRDPDNPAMVGLRLADRPAFWVNFRAIGTLPNPVVVAEGARHAWRGLWKNTTLRYVDSAHKLTKEIILRERPHPVRFRFSVRLPPHLTLVFRNGGGAILGPNGNERLTLLTPWGRDANDKTIGVTMRQGLDTVRGLPVIVIEVNEDDLVGASYPVTIDPTTIISGTTDIEDADLVSLWPFSQYNYGGLATANLATNAPTHLLRLVSGIPNGNITGFRFFLKSMQSNTNTIQAHFVADANDYVEGSGGGIAPEVGACNWFYAKHATQSWAGSNGCNTSGVDYDADLSPPTLALSGATGWETFVLDSEWPPLWRDGIRTVNGMRITMNTGTSARWWASEAPLGVNQPYFEIDYEEAAAASIAAMSLPRRIHE